MMDIFTRWEVTVSLALAMMPLCLTFASRLMVWHRPGPQPLRCQQSATSMLPLPIMAISTHLGDSMAAHFSMMCNMPGSIRMELSDHGLQLPASITDAAG